MAKTPSAKVTAEFDVNTGKFETGIGRVIRKAKESKDAIDLLAHSAQILTGAFGAVKFGVDKFEALSGGIIRINSDFETLKTSLTGLISASHSNIDSLGRLMGVQEKWTLSTKKADDTLKKLSDIASRTSFNLDQSAQMFKSFYSTASSSMSLEQSIEAFKGLANMASVVGINVDQMIRTLDGVGSGKWTSSELTRFLEGSLGLTKEAAQEAIKAGKYYDLLIEKTSEFSKMADATGNTFKSVTEAFRGEVENLVRSLTGGMFNSFKDGIKEATNFLKENKDTIVGAANTAVELAKHLGALGAAYYGARLANNLYDKAVKAMTASALLSNQALSAKTKALGLLSISIDKAKTATLALKAAFKSFLPTAGILLATEAIMSFSASLTTAEKNAEKLKKTLALTNDEIAKLTKNQLRDKEIELSAALYAKNEEMRQLGFKLRRDGKSLSSSSELDALKSEYKSIKEYLEKIEQAKKGLLAQNENSGAAASLVQNQVNKLNDALDKASEKAKNVTTLGRLKTELAEIDGLIKNLQKPLNDPEREKQRLDTLEALQAMREKTAKQIAEFNKQDIKSLSDINSSYREIARVGMSEYAKKLDDINQKYKEWLEYGVNKDVALNAKNKLISDAQAAETARQLKAKSEIYKEYYEKIGDYAKLWELKRHDVEKSLKDAGLNGEEYQKMLGFSRDAFMQKAREQAQENRVKTINEELKLKDREYALQKRRTELITDETARRIELIEIERAHALEQYNAMLKKGEINKEYYDKAMRLENALYQKQIFDASTWGQIMYSGLNSLESAMGNFFDYSSDRFMKFGDLAQDILGQIYKQIVKMTIIQPLINSVTGMLPGMFGGSTTRASLPSGGMPEVLNSSAYYKTGSGLFAGTRFQLAAQGGVFSSPDLHSYANSVVNRPTFFKFAKGGIPDIGVMGEKNGGSPEAIMPLTRTSNGDLGVKAQVSTALNDVKIEVINQTREDVKVSNAAVRRNDGEWVISLVLNGVSKNVLGSRETLRGLLA